MMEFNNRFSVMHGETLTLRLIETCMGDENIIPFYYYDIYLNHDNTPIGKISIRIGHNKHSYYNGNLGYEIDESYRGQGYAAEAVKMTYDIALHYMMDYLIASCHHDNYQSISVIEKLGGIYLETIMPPKDYIFYYEGMPEQSIFRIDLA